MAWVVDTPDGTDAAPDPAASGISFDADGKPRIGFNVDMAAGRIVPTPDSPKPDDAAQAPPPQQQWVVDDQPPQPRTMAESLGRQAALGGRYAVEGLTALPAMVGDAANAATNIGSRGINAMAGTKIPMLPPMSKGISDLLTTAGVPNPETPGERIVGDASRAVASVPAFAETAAMSGIKSLAPLAENLGTQARAAIGSAVAGGGAREGGAPTWAQILASLAGGGAAALTTAENPDVTKRLTDFKSAGVTPSVGDATQAPFWQWVQKVVGVVPGADNVVAKNEAARVGQAAQSAGDVASGYGSPQSAASTGEAVQDAIQKYRFGDRPDGMTDSDILTQPTRNSSIATKADVLFNRIPIPGGASIEADRTMQAVTDAAAKFDNPELSDQFASPLMAKMAGILNRSGGLMTWDDLRNLRTEIRYLRSKATLDPTVDDRALSQVNDALTQDMIDGARVHGGDKAAEMVTRADQYYRTAMQSVSDKLKTIYGTNRPEGVYSQVQSALSANPNKADIGKLSELQRVMPKDEWGNLAASIIDGFGRPAPGAAIAPDAPQFSVAQFVTRYNQISPEAKELLFNGAGQGDLKNSLDSLARSLGYMKTADKFANTSNTANIGIKAGFGTAAVTAGASALHGNLLPAAGLASTILGATIGARAMYNPTFVKLMAQSIAASPQGKAQTVAQIAKFAMENPALAPDAQELIRGIAKAPAQTDQSEEPK